MPSLYRIYFSRDSTVLSLPINPEKLPETKESDNGEYNVLGLGPVMQPRTPKPVSYTHLTLPTTPYV